MNPIDITRATAKVPAVPGAATLQQRALLRAVKVIHAQMVAARTADLRVHVVRDTVVHHYQFRLVKIEGKFEIKASAPVNERSPRPMAGKKAKGKK